MHEAKTQLSKLIERALAGEEVVIARHGEPAVRLTPVASVSGKSRRDIIGFLAGEVRWPPSAEEREMDRRIAAEMLSTDKFDVELTDSLELIPGQPR